MKILKSNPTFKKIARRNGKYKGVIWDLCVNAAENIRVCEEDKLINIMPIVALFNMNTKSLKAYLGKARWKAITKNTFERNQTILFIICGCNKIISQNEKREMVSFLYDLSDTCLNITCDAGLRALGFKFVHIINDWSKVCDEAHVKRRLNMLKDTKKMARRLNYPFNPNAKWKDIEALHGTLTTLYDGLKIKVPVGEDFILPVRCQKIVDDEIRDNDFSIKILKCLSDFSAEKRLMRHCILSYCESSYKKRYVACHLELNDYHTTLGIIYSQSKKRFRQDQHYGKSNQVVKDKRFLAMAENIVHVLNKEIEKK